MKMTFTGRVLPQSRSLARQVELGITTILDTHTSLTSIKFGKLNNDRDLACQ